MLLDKMGDRYVLKARSTYYIKSIDMINNLGSGSFGDVFKATDDMGATYAIKRINKSCGVPFERIKNEVEIMISVKNQYNLLPALDFTEDDQYVYIIMSCIEGGSLTSVINKKEIESERMAVELLRQICYGLKVLYDKNIIHRDLKTDNILCQKNTDPTYKYKYYLLICDYGLAKIINDNQINALQTMNVGTAFTQAPEVQSGLYDSRADVYSLGCIFYKMLTGKEPFNGNSVEEVRNRKLKFSQKDINALQISVLSKEILKNCLEPVADKRWTTIQLCQATQAESIYSNYIELDLNPRKLTIVHIGTIVIKANKKEGENAIEHVNTISIKANKKERGFTINYVNTINIEADKKERKLEISNGSTISIPHCNVPVKWIAILIALVVILLISTSGLAIGLAISRAKNSQSSIVLQKTQLYDHNIDNAVEYIEKHTDTDDNYYKHYQARESKEDPSRPTLLRP